MLDFVHTQRIHMYHTWDRLQFPFDFIPYDELTCKASYGTGMNTMQHTIFWYLWNYESAWDIIFSDKYLSKEGTVPRVHTGSEEMQSLLFVARSPLSVHVQSAVQKLNVS